MKLVGGKDIAILSRLLPPFRAPGAAVGESSIQPPVIVGPGLKIRAVYLPYPYRLILKPRGEPSAIWRKQYP